MLIQNFQAGGYGSEFEYDSEAEAKRAERKNDFGTKRKAPTKLASKSEVTQEYVKDEGRRHRLHFLALDAYARHKQMVNNYMLYYGGAKSDFNRDTSKDRRDIDVIREHHQFLWEDEDEEEAVHSWEKRLAKKYYDKLFKEYCITDLSRYKENKIAMRWRIEKEVIEGKGQFSCGNKRCSETEGLRSWEVNFGYVEQGEKKNALVKLRLCPDCSYKLNYHKKRREVKARKRRSLTEPDVQNKKQKTDEESNPQETSNEESQSSQPAPSASSSNTDREQTDNIWAGPAKIVEEKSQEEEFDEYFEDMFL